MVSRILCVSVFLLFNSAFADLQVCKPYQIWRMGHKPEPSCSNFSPTETASYEGCYCITDYVRDANDECIYHYDCPQFKPTPTTPPSCPVGESYRTDLYPEPSCNNLYPEVEAFKEGCFCDDYGVRDGAGKCIFVYECPQFVTSTTTTSTPVCPTGEVFGMGMYPEPSCDEFYPKNIEFYEGCFCKENFVRDALGKCISYLNCPVLSKRSPQLNPTCPDGEEYRFDFVPESRCDNKYIGNITKIYACFCLNSEDVRDSSGKCINYKDCPPNYVIDDTTTTTTTTPGPPICPDGEEYRFDFVPESRCDNKYIGNITKIYACFCLNSEDVRDSSGKCINYKDCPPNYVIDDTTTTTTTTTPGPPIHRSFSPALKCIPGSTFQIDCNTCICNYDGTEASCTLKQCSSEIVTESTTKCPDNEKWKNGLYPEPTCDNFYPENVYMKEGCYCIDDFIRNAEGKCIKIAECENFKPSGESKIIAIQHILSY